MAFRIHPTIVACLVTAIAAAAAAAVDVADPTGEEDAYPPAVPTISVTPALTWRFAAACVLSAIGWRTLGAVAARASPTLRSLRSAMPKARDRAKVPKNAAALAHCVFCCLYGVPTFAWGLTWEPPPRYHCAHNVWRTAFMALPASFMGYLLQDLLLDLELAARGLVALPVDMVVHHLVFMAVMVLQFAYEKSCFVFTWLILGEMSSVPLLLRWFAIAAQRSAGSIGALSKAFAATFIVVRILLYVVCLPMWMMQDDHVFGSWDVWQLSPLLVTAGLGLNLVWLGKIVAMARGGGGAGRKRPEKKDR